MKDVKKVEGKSNREEQQREQERESEYHGVAKAVFFTADTTTICVPGVVRRVRKEQTESKSRQEKKKETGKIKEKRSRGWRGRDTEGSAFRVGKVKDSKTCNVTRVDQRSRGRGKDANTPERASEGEERENSTEKKRETTGQRDGQL